MYRKRHWEEKSEIQSVKNKNNIMQLYTQWVRCTPLSQSKYIPNLICVGISIVNIEFLVI